MTPLEPVITLRLDGRPIPFGRPDGRRRNPASYADYRKLLEDQLAVIRNRHRLETLTGPLLVEVIVEADRVYVELVPSTLTGRLPDLPGDLDNYVKGIFDALQTAKIIEDDRQIVRLEARFNDPASNLREEPIS